MKSRDPLRRRIVAGGLALVVVIGGSAAYDSWRLHEQLMAASERELGNLANALAAQAARSLQAVDVLLRDTSIWYESEADRLDARAIEAALASRIAGVSQASVLSIVDANGQQRHRSRQTGEPLADVSDRPYFIVHRDRPDAGMFVNQPVVTRTEGSPALVVSRRLNRQDGGFDGVVTAIVTVEQLRQMYASIDLGKGSALLLTQDDGTLVMRQPPLKGAAAGQTRYHDLPALKGGPRVDRAVKKVDGRAKLIAVVGIANQPLLLAVTRDEAEALRPWYEDMWSGAARTAIMSLLVLLTMVALLRQLRRLDLGDAERARLEARLQQTQRLEALGTLAGGIAHDFNNILGAILGFGEMAQRQADEGAPIRRHIDRVLQAGARARLLVRRVLDFSRSGMAERVPVNLQAVVEEVVAMLTPTLPAGLALRSDLRTGNAAVLGDATQLYQVVMNLCTNAVRAMDESGVLELGARRVDVAETRALFQGDLRPGRYVCVDVADSGDGIAPDVKARIFDPFFTTRKVGEGTGLGLSVVHGIVSDMGGVIDLADRPGRGTRVSVWLPIVGESERAPPPLAPDWARGNGEVVMIVDDEPPLVELAEELLAGLGYEPVGYGSSEAALRAFAADAQRFDAVLSDEMLPGISGSELAAKVREVRCDLPIALMSGNVSAALEARARAAGVQVVLHKPLALQELADCMVKLVGAGTAPATAPTPPSSR
jgi:signal transduction histidine kinase/ActR/RegA family two-component response regulator